MKSRPKVNGQRQAKRLNAAGRRQQRLNLQKTKEPFIPTHVLQQLAGTEPPRNKKIIKLEEQMAALLRRVKDLESERRRVLAVMYNARLCELLSPGNEPQGGSHSASRATANAAAGGSLSASGK